MHNTAIQFGAGNIGRGFIAQLFHESNYEVIFVDVVEPVVQALNAMNRYDIRIVGKCACTVPITNVRAIHGRDRDAVAREIADCAIACTAVGAGALQYIAPNLAAGLALRHKESGEPLNILICENLHDANDRLRHLVSSHLPESDRDAIIAKTGFVQAVVSRMVPLQTPEENNGDPLAIRVEAYKRLPVDANAVVGTLPEIVGVEPVANFEAYVERKLYTHNCAHATLGYLGWHKGIALGYEALENSEIRSMLEMVLRDTGHALVLKHGLDPLEHTAHCEDLLERFANRELGDTCFRLARDPLRKLAPNDRLVGAARLCESSGIDANNLALIIAIALRFNASTDPVAVALQDRIANEGVERIVEDVCAIRADEPLGKAITVWYKSLETISQYLERQLEDQEDRERRLENALDRIRKGTK